MMETLTEKFEGLRLDLMLAAAPSANYVPVVNRHGLVCVSGQVPRHGENEFVVGRVGETISIEQAQHAARLCAMNIFVQLKKALGSDFDRIGGCLRLRGYVNATNDFKEHPAVINGASDFIVEFLGERGRHTRTAIGCASLPRGVPVEIDADFFLLDSTRPHIGGNDARKWILGMQ